MTTQVSVGETDDPGFIEQLNLLLRGLLIRRSPQKLWIIQIDNWFDHKWLRFSGMGGISAGFLIGGYDVLEYNWMYDSVKVEFHQDKLTFPPFTPNRVLGQWSYVRIDNGYREVPLPRLPHRTGRRRSPTNLQRRVQDFSRSACFVWYSANTVANGKASVMVYSIVADRLESWFAAFNRHAGWMLHATKGITRSDVQEFLGAQPQ